MSQTTLNEKMNTQFTLSHDLLYLLQWLINHEHDKLKKLVVKALESGMYDHLQEVEHETPLAMIDDKTYAYTSIIDFFTLMESFLHDASRNYTKQKAREQHLLQSIDHIICDDDVLQSSLQHATRKNNCSVSQAKEVLFQEILKRWSSVNKNNIN